MQHHANNVGPVLMSTHYSYTEVEQNTADKISRSSVYVTKLML